MINYKTIAESNNFIVLDSYHKDWQVAETYQSQGELRLKCFEFFSNLLLSFPKPETAAMA